MELRLSSTQAEAGARVGAELGNNLDLQESEVTSMPSICFLLVGGHGHTDENVDFQGNSECCTYVLLLNQFSLAAEQDYPGKSQSSTKADSGYLKSRGLNLNIMLVY